eukprot:TRINITY_DN5316_c0_g1_i2.p1 TRINITY_DN5316_c0_g1~~TRINITY_DN5316_c0_g1_i2.p1  ORF type:complete len:892 (-),score=168.99 TRINITY_DN5316_c0_g1_i2:62-2737(-)
MVSFKVTFSDYLTQLRLLLKKNAILSVRNYKSTIVELLAPVFFLLILLIIQKAPSQRGDDLTPSVSTIGSLPLCKPYAEERCFTLMFSPSDSPLAIEIMTAFAALNDPPLTISTDINSVGPIVGVKNNSFIMDFVSTHPNVTQGAIVFDPICPCNNKTILNDLYSTNLIGLKTFSVWYNNTCPNLLATCPNYTPQIFQGINQAILAVASKQFNNESLINTTNHNFNDIYSNFNSDMNNENFASYLFQPQSTQNINSLITSSYSSFPLIRRTSDAVRTYGGLFFYCGSVFFFVILLYQIVFDKEHKLRQGMAMMGLKASSYWASWFVWTQVLSVLSTLILIAVGAACQFDFFLNTNFFVNFLNFFLFVLSMCQLAFFLSTFIDTTKSAVGIGMLFFIVGIIFQLIMSLMSQIIFPLIYQSKSTPAVIARVVLWLLPMFHFSKGVVDINNKSFTTGILKGEGYRWADLYTKPPLYFNGAQGPATIESFENQIWLAILYTGLAWYFDNILPGHGASNPPYFFLTPSYWGFSKKRVLSDVQLPLSTDINDDDVLREAQHADIDTESPVRVLRLTKVYQKYPFIKTKEDVLALSNLSLTLESGKIFSLLGRNGAGKTTAISILTGLFPPTSGDAYVFNKSIVNDIDEVRAMTGVCPQHDILFNELTAREHLTMFAELKKIPLSQRVTAVDNILHQVNLYTVGDHRVSSFSGGMKRRLSIAISCIGDPKIIFMDEPTTGLDILSRRNIWTMIQKIKEDKIIVLTTHSMEEADVLSDRIAIMSKGVLKCIGNSLHLKNKFGQGYRIDIVANGLPNVQNVKNLVLEKVPSTKIVAESGEYLVYAVSSETPVNIIVPFFRLIESYLKQQDSIIKSWAVSMATSLEEVFLKKSREKKSKQR